MYTFGDMQRRRRLIFFATPLSYAFAIHIQWTEKAGVSALWAIFELDSKSGFNSPWPQWKCVVFQTSPRELFGAFPASQVWRLPILLSSPGGPSSAAPSVGKIAGRNKLPNTERQLPSTPGPFRETFRFFSILFESFVIWMAYLPVSKQWHMSPPQDVTSQFVGSSKSSWSYEVACFLCSRKLL